MANIPDPRDAPPGTLPTFRGIKSAIEELERAQKSNGSAQGATDKGQAATLQGLSQQIATLAAQQNDLNGRLSYSATNNDTGSWSSNVSSTNYDFGPTITFTLDQPRVVSVTFQCVALNSAYAGASGSTVTVNLNGRVKINGVQQSSSSISTVSTGATYSGGVQANQVDGTIISRWVGNLPAGTHTARGNFSNLYIGMSGSFTTAFLGVNSPFLFVDVMQTTG